jgi:hypothetical protein
MLKVGYVEEWSTGPAGKQGSIGVDFVAGQSVRSARARVGGDMIMIPSLFCFLVVKKSTCGARWHELQQGKGNGKRTTLKPSTVENSL